MIPWLEITKILSLGIAEMIIMLLIGFIIGAAAGYIIGIGHNLIKSHNE